jgi:inner membrane protein
METTQSNPHIFERINTWIRESTTVKLGSIGFLILILLIPQSWIESMIVERQSRAETVVGEIADKWSGQQTIAGPVLVIPFLKHEKIDKGKDGFEIHEWRENAFFLPEDLTINGRVSPQIRKRGIFEAVVYESSLSMASRFPKPDFKKLNILPADVLWKDAYLVLGISDLRGISENPKLEMGGHLLAGEPSNSIGLTSEIPENTASDNEYRKYIPPPPSKTSENGIVVRLPWEKAEDFSEVSKINLDLKGSTLLYFSPVGKTTTVKLAGAWPHPSFDGNFLPVTHTINNAGFSAEWKALHFNRPFSQQWTGSSQKISGSEFGVRLLIPVDQYQKSYRTAKYGVLIILLTFISLFMVEIMKKIRIHPFQYILMGAALTIYYCLLLSFSEHLGYNIAYLIASVATVALITGYSITFLRERQTVILFGTLLVFFYGFIFVIIQEQDYSLLLGSSGLFLVIAAIMYFSRNIKWYKETEIA